MTRVVKSYCTQHRMLAATNQWEELKAQYQVDSESKNKKKTLLRLLAYTVHLSSPWRSEKLSADLSFDIFRDKRLRRKSAKLSVGRV